jgi:hypothetical protein
MTRTLTAGALLSLLATVIVTAEGQPPASQILPPLTGPLTIMVRPAMLGDHIGTFAGHLVEVPSARVVRVYGDRAMVVETAGRVRYIRPTRVLVLLDAGAIRVPARQLMGESVVVTGVARTLLGLQTGGDVAWPTQLDRGRLNRLDVRGAVLASSIQTAEGIELTNRVPVQ